MKETPEVVHTRHVGPYRLEACLGRGGLGEVWRAWDGRLERWVAVKRLHADIDAAGRGRLLHEARAAARLAHPAIVQVFDVLEHDGVGWIVMEVVEGRDLATLADGRPLDVALVLDYARQIAEGLAAAHAAGVVHRDLKGRNVMVSAAGRIKILDFGLAKKQPLDGAQSDSLTLSAPQHVIGTPWSMSPEQALGRVVDFRTDLFALGVLIYELLTGLAPFRGSSVSQSLARVVTYQQPPVETLNPQVPPALAELVSQLLEKEPGFRPQAAAEVAQTLVAIASGSRVDATRSSASQNDEMTLGHPESVVAPPGTESSNHGWIGVKKAGVVGGIAAALVLAGILFFLTKDRRTVGNASQHLVAVLKTDLGVGTPAGGEVDDLAFTVREALVRALSSFEGMASASTKEVDGVVGPPTAVARAVGADEVLESTLHCGRSDCSLELRRVEGSAGRILGDYRIELPPTPLLDAARAVGIGMRQTVCPGAELRPGVDERIETTPEDFTIFVSIQRAFDKRPGILEATIMSQQLARLQERSPRFVEAALLEARITVFCYQQTRKQSFLDRALDRVAHAQALASRDPRVLSERAYVELASNRLPEAELTLEVLEGLDPGGIDLLDMLANLHDKHGEATEALALAKMALERRPSWQRLLRHARLAMKLGKLDLARGSLTRLLEQNPDHVAGLSFQASLELVNGDPRRAAELYERLISLASTPMRQSNLGLAYMLLGDYGASAVAFESTVEAAPKYPLFVLNLADSRWLEGRREEARRLYQEVLLLEPAMLDSKWLMLRAQALAHLGRHQEAATATREALETAPEDPGTAFEAALVFTLAGQLEQAAAHAERAIDLGYEPHWFDLPWFDALRAHPGFTGTGAKFLKEPMRTQPPPVGPGSPSSATEG